MAEKPSTPKIRVGPAGWPYKDWIGIAYPKNETAAFSRSDRSGELPSNCIACWSKSHPRDPCHILCFDGRLFLT